MSLVRFVDFESDAEMIFVSDKSVVRTYRSRWKIVQERSLYSLQKRQMKITVQKIQDTGI